MEVLNYRITGYLSKIGDREVVDLGAVNNCVVASSEKCRLRRRHHASHCESCCKGNVKSPLSESDSTVISSISMKLTEGGSCKSYTARQHNQMTLRVVLYKVTKCETADGRH
jgi:hypothetical protein